MSNETENHVPPTEAADAPDPATAQSVEPVAPDGTVVTTEHLSELAEWLQARLDALDTRFDRFDQISTRNTRRFSDDMTQMRDAVTHLHQRVGQLVDGHQNALRAMVREEVRAALQEEREHVARKARRRAVLTLSALTITAAGLVWGVLVLLEMLPLPSP